MENSSIKILFENDQFLIVDKPAGMVVNKADTQKTLTVQEWLEQGVNKQILNELSNTQGELEKEFFLRGGIVHRLDKETSGILVLAKTPQAFEHLKNQFKSGLTQKTYLTLVHGRVAPREGEINVPIGRLPWNRMRFGVLVGGREAQTFYKVIRYFLQSEGKKRNPLTLVEMYPKTGRTHQIRVHMQHLGFPLFSDELYAGRKQAKADRKLLPRHFLHAVRLTLTPPGENSPRTFESPLPGVLRTFLESLEATN